MKYYYCLYDDGNDRILKVSDDIDCLSNESIKTGSFELSHLHSLTNPIYLIERYISVNFKGTFFNYLEIDLEDGYSCLDRQGIPQ